MHTALVNIVISLSTAPLHRTVLLPHLVQLRRRVIRRSSLRVQTRGLATRARGVVAAAARVPVRINVRVIARIGVLPRGRLLPQRLVHLLARCRVAVVAVAARRGSPAAGTAARQGAVIAGVCAHRVAVLRTAAALPDYVSLRLAAVHRIASVAIVAPAAAAAATATTSWWRRWDDLPGAVWRGERRRRRYDITPVRGRRVLIVANHLTLRNDNGRGVRGRIVRTSLVALVERAQVTRVYFSVICGGLRQRHRRVFVAAVGCLPATVDPQTLLRIQLRRINNGHILVTQLFSRLPPPYVNKSSRRTN